MTAIQGISSSDNNSKESVVHWVVLYIEMIIKTIVLSFPVTISTYGALFYDELTVLSVSCSTLLNSTLAVRFSWDLQYSHKGSIIRSVIQQMHFKLQDGFAIKK